MISCCALIRRKLGYHNLIHTLHFRDTYYIYGLVGVCIQKVSGSMMNKIYFYEKSGDAAEFKKNCTGDTMEWVDA